MTSTINKASCKTPSRIESNTKEPQLPKSMTNSKSHKSHNSHFNNSYDHYSYNDPLDPQLQLGLILKDKYRLDSILGEGSFAVVFKASALSSRSTASSPSRAGRHFVAVKCLYKTGLTKNQIALQREEVKVMEKVSQHPNITSLLDTIDTPDHLYLVMELCHMDLFDGILSPSFKFDALDLFGQLVDAVAHCHERGVYHRDLKPENILLTSKGEIRLTDFGLATTDSLSSDFGCGSVRYMSPECLAGQDDAPGAVPYLSASNDVWSLAIILINMLTGKNPWVEPSKKDKHFRAHLLSKSSLMSVDSFRSQFNFSDSLCQVLRGVFQSKPENRPSARSFLDSLQRIPSLFHQPSSLRKVEHNISLLLPPPSNNNNSTLSSEKKELISQDGLITPSSFSSNMSSHSPVKVQGVPTKTIKTAFSLPPTPEVEPWRMSPLMKSVDHIPTSTYDTDHQEAFFEMEEHF